MTIRRRQRRAFAPNRRAGDSTFTFAKLVVLMCAATLLMAAVPKVVWMLRENEDPQVAALGLDDPALVAAAGTDPAGTGDMPPSIHFSCSTDGSETVASVVHAADTHLWFRVDPDAGWRYWGVVAGGSAAAADIGSVRPGAHLELRFDRVMRTDAALATGSASFVAPSDC